MLTLAESAVASRARRAAVESLLFKDRLVLRRKCGMDGAITVVIVNRGRSLDERRFGAMVSSWSREVSAG
jgi:hypothetical protein